MIEDAGWIDENYLEEFVLPEFDNYTFAVSRVETSVHRTSLLQNSKANEIGVYARYIFYTMKHDSVIAIRQLCLPLDATNPNNW